MRYIINSDFKAVMKGEYAEPSTSSGEFVLDTEDESTLTGAIIEGVAEANKIEVKGKSKADKLASLEEGLSKLKIGEVREPTVQQRIKDIVEQNVVDGALAASEDDLIVAIIESGIGFKQAGKGLKLVLEQLGLKVSNKDKLATAADVLTKMDFDPQNWGDVVDAAEKVAAQLPDVTERNAIGLIKKYAKTKNITLPAKPKKEKGEKGAGGVSGFKAKVVDFLAKNPRATMDDLVDLCVANKKSADVAKRFAWVLALANKLA